MGPTLLYDKSFIQSLSYDEIYILNKLFTINIAPVLIDEIRGDLLLNKCSSDKNISRVISISKKLLSIDLYINAHYRSLITYSLLGYQLEKSRRPVLANARLVKNNEGDFGYIIDLSEEELCLIRWKNGEFTSNDYVNASKYRNAINYLDLEWLRENNKSLFQIIKRPINVAESLRYTDDILYEYNNQYSLLQLVLSIYVNNNEQRQRILNRWNSNIHKHLSEFSWYSFYCIRIYILFLHLIISGLLGPRKSHIIDMEYLFYLPFTNVFVSNDRLHHNISRLFMDEDQTYIKGNYMKKELRRIKEHLDDLKGLKDWRQYDFNLGPPLIRESHCIKAWKKTFPNWNPFDNRENITSDYPEIIDKNKEQLVRKIQNLYNNTKEIREG